MFLGSVVSIGAFDGVHRGHQTVISHAVDRARELGVSSLVYTFDPPPRHYFQNAKVLTSIEEKLMYLETLGVDQVVIASFNECYINRTSKWFIDTLRRFNPLEIHVGMDFRFGKNRAGDIDLLAKHFNVKPTKPVCCPNGDVISSTRIRNLLSHGRFKEALTLLDWSSFNNNRKQLSSTYTG
ncbi:FAD synthetase [Bacillus sp. RAR_GA_16]|uniref:FAD synthetase n=1 Tax=Bacillus sp. RAR_GA_16 TaxID=2876774 RepID=UPI001CCE1E4A|nr:FAD synthetase [Bacillus sp. RAR_GA_16]MCA0174583.1 FAD synthetase [Bacillus sp. RAR_GA_16]